MSVCQLDFPYIVYFFSKKAQIHRLRFAFHAVKVYFILKNTALCRKHCFLRVRRNVGYDKIGC